MTRLNGVWAIEHAGTPLVELGVGRVTDVEALVRGAIRAARPDELTPDDELETLAHLFERVVILIGTFDPTRGGILFRPWLYQELRLDAIDFWRSFHGRKGEKRVADSRRLEQAVRDAGVDDGDSGLDRPDHAHAAGADGVDGDRAFPRAWTDLPGDRGPLAPAPVGGLRGGEGASDPRRARRGGAPAGGRDERRAQGADSGALAFLDCLICGWRSYPAHDGVAWRLPDFCRCGLQLELVPDYPPLGLEELAA